jgi:hypothetical protein
MSDRADPNRKKHLHVIMPFRDWLRLKDRLAREEKQLSSFVHRLVVAELDGVSAHARSGK